MPRIGVHVSIAGHIYESLERAKALGCDTMQIFSRNPRGWQAAALGKDDAATFRRLKAEYDICPVVIHIPYIINLATPDDKLYEKSIEAYIEDIARVDLLGAEYFVTHLGSHTGSGEASGLKRFAAALNAIMERARPKAMILLENTAGSGDSIGYRFEHIRDIMDHVDEKKNIGVCLDTAHTFESGYDIKTSGGFEKTMKEFDKMVGLDRIRVVHFNDSLSQIGSRVDRHQHIGKGNIGSGSMARIINYPKLSNAAFIMETPKESEEDDIRNLKAARKLIKR